MNISPAKLAAASAILVQSSRINLAGPFVDMFQVPQGKVGIILAGSVSSADVGGDVVTVAVCDQSYNFGQGPSVDPQTTFVDPNTCGVALNVLNVSAGVPSPFNDDFDFSSPDLAIPAGWFLRVCIADNKTPLTSGVMIVTLMAALVDECDCA